MQLYTIPGTTRFADVYGSGAYNEGTYGCAATDTACLAGTDPGGGKPPLVDTGIMISLVVGFAALLLLAVLLVRLWRRPAVRPTAQPVTTAEEAGDTPAGEQPRI